MNDLNKIILQYKGEEKPFNLSSVTHEGQNVSYSSMSDNFFWY